MTLDPDVKALLRRAMRESGSPLERVSNDALRESLLGMRRRAKAAGEPFRQITFDMGVPLVDLTKANALAGELEDEELIAKMRQGR